MLSSRRWLWVAAGLVLVLVLAPVVFLLAGNDGGDSPPSTGPQQSTGSASDEQRADVVDAVNLAVPLLLSYHSATFQQDFAAVAPMLDQRMQTSYSGLLQQLQGQANAQGTDITGRVLAAGITDVTATTAHALVFVDTATRTSSTPTPELQHGRMVVTLVRQGESWLVDDLSQLAAAEPVAETDADRRSALDAARAIAAAFATLDYRTADRDLDAVLARSTGGFAQEFAAERNAVKKVAVDNRTTSKGTALAAGLEAMSADSATVLVAADAEVSSSKNGKTGTRSYRIRMVLKRDGSDWKVAELGLA
jgi:Mce-associated membrane protein